MAYVESNDTEVHRIEYSWYGQEQYPSTVSIPYPKVRRAVPGSCSGRALTLFYYFFIVVITGLVV